MRSLLGEVRWTAGGNILRERVVEKFCQAKCRIPNGDGYYFVR
jgi:hypothetical protein